MRVNDRQSCDMYTCTLKIKKKKLGKKTMALNVLINWGYFLWKRVFGHQIISITQKRIHYNKAKSCMNWKGNEKDHGKKVWGFLKSANSTFQNFKI